MIAQRLLRRLGLAAGLLLLAALAGGMSGRVTVAQGVKPKPLTPEQQKHLQEWADLLARLNALLQKGKHAEAVALVERKVALDRKFFGEAHVQVDKSLTLLAQFCEFLE